MGLVLLLVFTCLVAGCGSQEPTSGATRDSSAPTQTHVPADLEQVLAREGIEVADASQEQASQLPLADDVVDRFSEYFEPSFESDPMVYSVEIVASNDTSLTAGRWVDMVHIADVEHEVNPPAAPRGSDGATLEPTSAQVVVTDMFTFFDATTEEHLVTVYIGPAAGQQ